MFKELRLLLEEAYNKGFEAGAANDPEAAEQHKQELDKKLAALSQKHAEKFALVLAVNQLKSEVAGVRDAIEAVQGRYSKGEHFIRVSQD